MDSIEKNKMIAEFMGARVEVQTEVAQPYFRGISWTGCFCMVGGVKIVGVNRL